MAHLRWRPPGERWLCQNCPFSGTGPPSFRFRAAAPGGYWTCVRTASRPSKERKKSHIRLLAGMAPYLADGIQPWIFSKSEAGYGENFWVTFPGGKSPFIYPAKERRLTKGEAK